MIGLGSLVIYIFFAKGLYGLYQLIDDFSWPLLLFRVLIVALTFRLVLAVSKIQNVYKSMEAETYDRTTYMEKTEAAKLTTEVSVSTKISTVIGDVFRWMLALIILPIIIWLVFLFFMYPFEWLLSISTSWSIFWHVSFWLVLGGAIVSFATILGTTILKLSALLVRQSSVYFLLLFLSLLILVGFCIYGAWSDSVDFSWEVYRYKTFNKIAFTLLMMSMLQISTPVFNNRSVYT